MADNVAAHHETTTPPPAAPDERSSPVPFGIPLGARLIDSQRCEFRVWAPGLDRVGLHILEPDERRVPLTKNAAGYHEAVVDRCAEGTRYLFVLDDRERPDPASRFQPDGVHTASAVVGRDFPWTGAGWKGIPLLDYVIYELHVGTFTHEGTFDAVIPHLDRLKDLGISAVELLPVAQFPGARNWGYDGVYIGAAQNSYGGPRALKRLVDACHARGLAIVLDVVYNHLGPEGNYLREYGPYFTDRYKTPWGPALNFDGPQSDHVRWFFIHNALQWIDEFHFDALRVDAVHAIIDHTAEPFLQDLTTAVRARAAQLGRRIYTIAESDLNDPRVITPKEDLGLGFDTQWNDDYHHSLHALLTGERAGYYEGFGKASDLARTTKNGYLYTGQHSTYRGRKYGVKPKTTDGAKFIVCAQNHDQVGNRMFGDRLSTIVAPDKLRLAAAAIVLSPFLPMLFMGEEYGEKSPFQYFTSHSDENLIAAVRKGRRDEFEEFAWQGEAPDPHDDETFRRSKLNWQLLERDEHASLWRLYKELLRIRHETPALRTLDLASLDAEADDERSLVVVRRGNALVAFNFSDKVQRIGLRFRPAEWRALIDTGAKIEKNRLTMPPFAFAVFAASSS
ncbi:MAG TPA: malto-oligosyltrehalose trehalohydrolase [Thermoanaerobaculia bacterium]|nr:malto-oligosyltrehalose trehalohydrolase [Thermoanaerobaculia bacterium]